MNVENIEADEERKLCSVEVRAHVCQSHMNTNTTVNTTSNVLRREKHELNVFEIISQTSFK